MQIAQQTSGGVELLTTEQLAQVSGGQLFGFAIGFGVGNAVGGAGLGVSWGLAVSDFEDWVNGK
jgi:bacteriocin-like protein